MSSKSSGLRSEGERRRGAYSRERETAWAWAGALLAGYASLKACEHSGKRLRDGQSSEGRAGVARCESGCKRGASSWTSAYSTMDGRAVWRLRLGGDGVVDWVVLVLVTGYLSSEKKRLRATCFSRSVDPFTSRETILGRTTVHARTPVAARPAACYLRTTATVRHSYAHAHAHARDIRSDKSQESRERNESDIVAAMHTSAHRTSLAATRGRMSRSSRAAD